MRKKRFIYTLAAVLLMCSAAGVGAGCGKSSPALLDSFGTHLDTLMTSKDKLSKMDGAAADLCVIENEDGSFTDVDGSDTLYESDSVIISISQGPMTRLVNSTKGLNANKRGLLEADETGHTSRPGIFASGDVVNGARTVVEAVAHSKIVAESMHEYMQSLKDSTD